ncbi:MAG: alpha amylase N-terminal ig-like domain-containing protein, partial [Clostridia bacterium]|nr:alpha amylase N-terminal ig-like domain-containing protein [Clostridia bacterium]
MINRQVLFTDETESFKTPYEPEAGDKVTLTFRTLANDVQKVYAIINGKTRLMKKQPKRDETFDYYAVTFTCGAKPVSYFFKVTDEDDELYYNRTGAVNN